MTANLFLIAFCLNSQSQPFVGSAKNKIHHKYLVISREAYAEKLYGFWLGECIANWIGLVTEMDKIGNIGDKKTSEFYTRHYRGKPDQLNIWGQGIPSDLSKNIDFVFRNEDGIWCSDDDTDIEYMYLELLIENNTCILSEV